LNDRRDILRFVEERLGTRDLYWAGLRSDDIEGLADLPQLVGAFSIIGGYERPTAVPSEDFELLWGTRMDVDRWDIDDQLEREAVHEFRYQILHRLRSPSAVFAYRPTRFLSSITFSRSDQCLYLGMFSEHQAAFDHKPWVESSLGELGVERVTWTYVANEERNRVLRMLENGPVMLRPSRSSGGTGLLLVSRPAEVDSAWPHQRDAFAGVAPYLEGAVPVNIGATVWRDGGVTCGHPSVQLIGLSSCTEKPFGYCGNDFGATRDLEGTVLEAVEHKTRIVGGWLGRHGYVGTFGVDFLVHDGVALFTEVNPRFQGSTHASCQLSVEAGESCLMLDHLAALLGAKTPLRESLRSVVRRLPTFATVVVHWQGDRRQIDVRQLAGELRAAPNHVRTDVQAHPTLPVDRGATVIRATTRSRLTTQGHDLAEPWCAILDRWKRSNCGMEP
jgi:formate-dependent phosphoribosylglycinamide formyltransferase (GAR transformylase)